MTKAMQQIEEEIEAIESDIESMEEQLKDKEASLTNLKHEIRDLENELEDLENHKNYLEELLFELPPEESVEEDLRILIILQETNPSEETITKIKTYIVSHELTLQDQLMLEPVKHLL